MKKLFLFIAVIMLMAFTVNAQYQTMPTLVSKGTSTQAEQTVTTPRHCGTMEYLEVMKQQDPTLEARMQAEEQKFNEYIAEHQYELENNKTAYTLPVVVHVCYSGLSRVQGYVTPAQVAEQITQTNKDWAGTNGRNMELFSSSLRADCGITLCLATVDPSGNPTTGIDYKQTTVTSWNMSTNTIKYTSTGGAAYWDATKYLNIWVGHAIYYGTNSLCGYAQFPTSGINATYGVVIESEFFGMTGATYPYNGGGTTSHEFGHCFNLYHIWGDDGGTCTGSDNCTDTPNQASETYGNHSNALTDACTSTSPGIMYMNFMDYSDDADYANMTPNQAARMQTAVSTYLTSVANNAATICNTGPAAPIAAFTWTPTSPVVNSAVQFTDQSSNTPTGWAWTFGDGGTSTAQNPTHTYTATGTYSVCLTASNATGNNQVCHSVVVSATPPAGCDTIVPTSFTTAGCSLVVYVSDVTPYDSGYIAGQNAYLDKEKAQLFTGVANGFVSDVYVMYPIKAGTGNTSVKIYSSNAGAPGTLLGTSATIAKSAIDTTNHGVNYHNIYHFTSPVPVGSDFFVSVVLPSGFTDNSNELAIWAATYTCAVTTEYEMWSDNSWNAFMDVYGANIDMAIFPDICTTTGVNELSADNEVMVYPNPSSDVFNVVLPNYANKSVKVNVYNTIGALVKTINSTSSPLIKVDLSGEQAGIYYMSIITDEGTIIKKISIIK
jgi:PKD repeat protein